MTDYDVMTHVELAKTADALREERWVSGDNARRAQIDAELTALDNSARKRPQVITGAMKVGN